MGMSNKQPSIKTSATPYTATGVEWEYVNLRNISLLQISFWATGLNNPGFYPPLRFHFGNYIGYGVPGEGNHGIFDKRLMRRTLKTLQADIDQNKNFVQELHKRAQYIYRNVHRSARALRYDLDQLTDTELNRRYRDFREALVFSPIILMPMYAVDGCLDEQYRIVRFLKKKRVANIDTDISTLSTTTYPSVAFAERESFLKLALAVQENRSLLKEFLNGGVTIPLLAKRYPDILHKLHVHREHFDWVNSEYLSDTWSDAIYLTELAHILTTNPAEELRAMRKKAAVARQERAALIRALDPPVEVARALDALNEFVWEVDYSKGVFSEAFLYFRNLLKEVAERHAIAVEDLNWYNINEFDSLIGDGTTLPTEEIAARKTGGYLMLYYKGAIRVYSGKDRQLVAKSEHIEHFFKPAQLQENFFKGVVGSRGTATGKVHVIRNIADLDTFREGEILVTHMTTMEFTPLFHKAVAVVTDEGGLGCHAAIVSREFRLPCVVGTKIATQVLRDGDTVEVDAERGIITMIV
jgi:phosphohistidine swiveling domain-containing protein